MREEHRLTADAAGEAAVSELPETVRIGPFIWTIEVWDTPRSEAKEWGDCRIDDLCIGILRAQPSPRSAVDTVIHEFGHAIYRNAGLERKDEEERIVAIFATGWTQIFCDNPWLAPWIARWTHCGVEQPGSSAGS